MQISTHTMAAHTIASSFATGSRSQQRAQRSGQQRKNKKHKNDVTVSIGAKPEKPMQKDFDFEAYKSVYGWCFSRRLFCIDRFKRKLDVFIAAFKFGNFVAVFLRRDFFVIKFIVQVSIVPVAQKLMQIKQSRVSCLSMFFKHQGGFNPSELAIGALLFCPSEIHPFRRFVYFRARWTFNHF